MRFLFWDPGADCPRKQPGAQWMRGHEDLPRYPRQAAQINLEPYKDRSLQGGSCQVPLLAWGISLPGLAFMKKLWNISQQASMDDASLEEQ